MRSGPCKQLSYVSVAKQVQVHHALGHQPVSTTWCHMFPSPCGVLRDVQPCIKMCVSVCVCLFFSSGLQVKVAKVHQISPDT